MEELHVPQLPSLRRTSSGEHAKHTYKTKTSEIDLIQSSVDERKADRQGHLFITDPEAVVNLIKGSLGSGFLAMPYAFSNSGLVLGVIGTTLVAIICTHCTYKMVKCSQELCRKEGKDAMTYADTVEIGFKTGVDGRFRKWSALIRCVPDMFIFFTYFGINIVYVIFIASTLKQVVDSNMEYSVNIRWYILLLTVLLLPIGLVRHMKLLAPLSALANLLLLVGCLLTLYFCFSDIPPISSRLLFISFKKWPIFLSTALFSMEGIGVVLPIENSMKNPSHFLGCFGVLNISMAIVASVYLIMGFAGYLKYGVHVQGSIILNLPDNIISDAVKILVALAILFTYPLQLAATTDVVWYRTSRWFLVKRLEKGQYIIRAILIICSAVTAVVVPDLSPVISLVGAIGFSGLGLLLPTVTEMVTFWDSLSPLLLAEHLLILVFWAIVTVTGTITSLQEILEQF